MDQVYIIKAIQITSRFGIYKTIYRNGCYLRLFGKNNKVS